MESPDIIKQGYAKVQSKHIGVWKKRWLVLRKKSSSGPARIEKYKSEEEGWNSKDLGCNATVLEMRRVFEIDRLPESVKKHAIVVSDHTKTLQFAADSEIEANRWLDALEESKKEIKRTQYAYKVYMMANDKLPTITDCMLNVGKDRIRLTDVRTNREFISWPFSALRRYGVERNMFTMEVGRAASTGEGHFHFDSEDPEAIYQCVEDAANRLKIGVNERNDSMDDIIEGHQNSFNNERADRYHSNRSTGNRCISSEENTGRAGASRLPDSCSGYYGSINSGRTGKSGFGDDESSLYSPGASIYTSGASTCSSEGTLYQDDYCASPRSIASSSRSTRTSRSPPSDVYNGSIASSKSGVTTKGDVISYAGSIHSTHSSKSSKSHASKSSTSSHHHPADYSGSTYTGSKFGGSEKADYGTGSIKSSSSQMSNDTLHSESSISRHKSSSKSEQYGSHHGSAKSDYNVSQKGSASSDYNGSRHGSVTSDSYGGRPGSIGSESYGSPYRAGSNFSSKRSESGRSTTSTYSVGKSAPPLPPPPGTAKVENEGVYGNESEKAEVYNNI